MRVAINDYNKLNKVLQVELRASSSKVNVANLQSIVQTLE